MPLFSELRSDYPLNFSSFGCPDMDALKRPFRAMVSLADSFNFRSLMPAQCCSSERHPSTRKSTPTLAEATPPVAQFSRRLVERLAHPVEHRRTNVPRNIGAYFHELPASLRLRKSATCTPDAVYFAASFARVVGREQIVLSAARCAIC
jgi:hypothetical protein